MRESEVEKRGKNGKKYKKARDSEVERTLKEDMCI
jgi:hypothetical protein